MKFPVLRLFGYQNDPKGESDERVTIKMEKRFKHTITREINFLRIHHLVVKRGQTWRPVGGLRILNSKLIVLPRCVCLSTQTVCRLRRVSTGRSRNSVIPKQSAGNPVRNGGRDRPSCATRGLDVESKTLLGAPGITTSSLLTTRNKKLLVAPS